MYYGEIDETLRTDLVQWSTHYWDRVDTGNTVKVGDFKFANLALNSPLFNPVRAVRPTLEQLKLVSTLDCDGMTALMPGFGNAAIAGSFRQAMSEWKLVTDSSTNAAGTAIHMNLITSAPAGSGVSWEVVGNDVISTKLPWSGVAGINTNPTIAPSISTSTQAAITKLITVGSIIAAASEGTSEAQSLITGEESHATKFERGVQQLMIGGGWNGTTWRIDATFGVFGSLPLVGVTFDDAFVLVDAVNGNLDGPFALSSQLNAQGLLVAHGEYTPSSVVVFVNGGGCKSVAAPQKKLVPCPTGTPIGTCLPPGFVQHGSPSPWVCVFTSYPAPGPGVPAPPGGTCVCKTEYRYIAPAPCPGLSWNPPINLPSTGNRCVIFETVTCSGGGANCGLAGCTNNSVPGTSPPAVPGSVGCTPSCTSKYEYWTQ